jgi:hypothetical protein
MDRSLEISKTKKRPEIRSIFLERPHTSKWDQRNPFLAWDRERASVPLPGWIERDSFFLVGCMIIASYCSPRHPHLHPSSPWLFLHVCAVVPAAAPQMSFCRTVGSPKLSRNQPLSVSYTVKFSATYGAIPITVGDRPRNNARSPPSSR